jgi:hypothetical protein
LKWERGTDCQSTVAPATAVESAWSKLFAIPAGTEEYELIRRGDRQFFKQGRVYYAEEGRVCANAQRQRQNSDDGEAGMLDEHVCAVAQVLEKRHLDHLLKFAILMSDKL